MITGRTDAETPIQQQQSVIKFNDHLEFRNIILLLESRNRILLLEDTLKKGQKQKDATAGEKAGTCGESPGKRWGWEGEKEEGDEVNFARGVEVVGCFGKSGI